MGDQTDDLAMNRRKDKNIPSIPQETHKPKQNSMSLSKVPGCSPKGMSSTLSLAMLYKLQSFLSFAPKLSRAVSSLFLGRIMTTPLAPGRRLDTARRTQSLKSLEQRLDLALPLTTCVTSGESSRNLTRQLRGRNKKYVCICVRFLQTSRPSII